MEEQDVTFVLPLKKIFQIMAGVIVLWILCMGYLGLFQALYYSTPIWEEFIRLKPTHL